MNALTPRKILFIHHASGYDGSATSMLTLIRYLDPARYTANVLIVHSVAEPLFSAIRAMGIPVWHLPARRVWDRAWYSRTNIEARAWLAFRSDPQIAEYLRTEQPDIIHINEVSPASVGITAHELGIPVIWHCRHVLVSTRPLLDPGRRLIRTMIDVSENIICISESEAALFPADKVEVIYNPLDFAKTNLALGTGPAARKALSIGTNEYVVVAPILLGKGKGAWDFIQACGIAAKIAPEIPMRFLVVGHVPTAGKRHLLRKWTGWLGPRPNLEYAHYLARCGGIEDRIHFTGFRKDIYEIMDGADLVVFPSHLRACGRPCFEAGALQKPILVTMPNKKTGVVLDGLTGMILPEKTPKILGKTIADLARDPANGRRMGMMGYEYVRKHFGADRHALRIMALYDRVTLHR